MTDTLLWLLTDLLLVTLVLAITYNAVLCRSLTRAIVLFMALGLVLALIWSRLKAPDLALAEAAIGSGIAGALLLAALRETQPDEQLEPFTRAKRLMLGGLSAGLFLFSWRHRARTWRKRPWRFRNGNRSRGAGSAK